MKIIFSNYDDIKNPFYGGGGAYAVHQIAKRFAQKGNKVTVITGKYNNSKTERISNVRYERVGISWFGPKLGQLIFHQYLPFLLKNMDFDLWVESFTPPFSTSFLPLFTKKPVIGLAHMLAGDDMKRKYKLPFNIIENFGLRFYRYFIILNQETLRKIKKVNKSSNIVMIPNGVDIPPVRSELKRSHILYIGRIEMNQKGLDLLLKAYSKINDSRTPKLVIAGGGNEKDIKNLNSLIKKLKLETKVNYAGRIEGKVKADLFRKAVFVTIPSRYETFSIVSLEAASYALPIISFDIEGLSWLPNNCALKIKHFNTDKFAQGMKRLVKDKTLRKRLGTKARSYIASYSWDNVFNKYEDFLIKINKSR